MVSNRETHAELDRFQAEVTDWAAATFGESTLRSRLLHAADELGEVAAAPGDSEEWADLFLILFHAALEEGHTVSAIVAAMRSKHQKNLKREWLPPDSDGVVRHVPGT